MPTEFQEKVYDLCRKIPRGYVTTYGEIARTMNTKAFRAVGQALRRNPYAPAVPCHRVVAGDGSLCGFGGSRGKKELSQKRSFLEQEGVSIIQAKIADFRKVLFRFP